MQQRQRIIELNVNGETHTLAVEPQRTLLEVLRDNLGLTGAKRGCDQGYCNACTVLVDGKAVNSCLILAVRAQGKRITTIEGLSHNGRMHPLQEAFVNRGAIQCGFCTPGMVLTAKALLDANPDPSEMQIRRAISGNLCRCTGYVKVVEAIKEAARVLKTGGAA